MTAMVNLPIHILDFQEAVIGERQQMAGCGCSNHRNRRHIADTQPADVNVGYGASISDSPMSAVSLYA
jgi:hypothetical protein